MCECIGLFDGSQTLHVHSLTSDLSYMSITKELASATCSWYGSENTKYKRTMKVSAVFIFIFLLINF